MFFDRLSLRARLLGGYLAVAAAGAVTGGAAVFGVSAVNDNLSTLYDKHLRGLSYVKQANVELIQVARYRALYAFAGDLAARKAYQEAFEKHVAAAAESLDQATPLIVSEQDQVLLQKARQDLATYLPHGRRFIEAVGTQEPPQVSDEIKALNKVAVETFKVVVDDVEHLAKRKEEVGAKAKAESDVIYRQVLAGVFGLTLLAVTLGVLLGVRIAAGVTRRLGVEPEVASSIAHRIASGDLGSAIRVPRGYESSLIGAMHAMQERLGQTVAEIRNSSGTISLAASEIAQGNSDLSGRTEQQASSLQQTASSMEQLTGTVAHNSQNAAQASVLAVNASDAARSGGQTVREVVDTMREINESSKRVAEIITVIDGIAFQTNILALNAAVEAARAGEQGRGFAVVASEVRQLAQRSASAAREIKALIAANVERVAAGAELADQAGTKMETIVQSIQRVCDIAGEIASASREQGAGIEQVGAAVSEMDRATQQNAALVEQSAAAAESLRQQARQLVAAVATFNLGSGEARI
ncbi:methyl-accepting chemotaxis protein [Aquabacterium sp. A7-Y]|uniref:methyl-accepting chemotaxis protein n=1 Tax=Aquabacterium sp. A7-Y TaxID=1349605 RepID=UPI002AC80A49|nr:methyl-accepting chemotaxis protein [Aquabacterium sp. A7-Y]